MGKPTGNFVRTTKSTECGSDRYGACELCGKHMTECFVSTNRPEWVRDDGSKYLGYGKGVFAHKACIEKLI